MYHAIERKKFKKFSFLLLGFVHDFYFTTLKQPIVKDHFLRILSTQPNPKPLSKKSIFDVIDDGIFF